ncbi:hypothetical protein BTVI_128268 [Pitangus sulphuratus]|nr:hypothetical protein BTVI_128268 [Pitangus sulphuratus]
MLPKGGINSLARPGLKIFWTDFTEFISGLLAQEEGRSWLNPRLVTGGSISSTNTEAASCTSRGRTKSLHRLVVNNGVNNDNGTNVLCLHELHLGKSASTSAVASILTFHSVAPSYLSTSAKGAADVAQQLPGMFCLRQEQKEAKPGLEKVDQTWAKRTCWVPQDPRPLKFLFLRMPSRQGLPKGWVKNLLMRTLISFESR